MAKTRSASATGSEPVPHDGVISACRRMSSRPMPVARARLSTSDESFAARPSAVAAWILALFVGTIPHASALPAWRWRFTASG